MAIVARVLIGLMTLAFLALALTAGGALALYAYYAPTLPKAAELREVELQTPLRIFTSDGRLIGEYAEQRRTPVAIEDIPERLKQAFIAAEDERFYLHPGIDPVGLTRAALNLASTGERSQGGSTITMQVARNFFLTRERTFDRKLREIVLAVQIERELSKDEILELYLNKIYLGHRAYGVAAAAEVYWGLALDELTLDQMAILAALPKAPSVSNPVTNPERAKIRRDYVLRRMLEIGFVGRDEFEAARSAPVVARLHVGSVEISAHWAAETARQVTLNAFGERAHLNGYRVFTTIDSRLQPLANRAVQRGILAYERRHGFRPTGDRIDDTVLDDDDALTDALRSRGRIGGFLLPAVVEGTDGDALRVRLWRNDELRAVTLPASATRWAGAAVNRMTRGELVWLEPLPDDGWALAQAPTVSGALVVQDPATGALLAWSSGFDFFSNRFDHVRQAQRQPGSAFKTFIYATALEQGWTPDSTINDAPMVFADPALGAEWRPENYTREFYGPTTLRAALAASRNLASIRLLNEIGVATVLDRLPSAYGLDPAAHPRNLSLTLGTGSTPPLALNNAYATFANGGRRVHPWLIQRIERANGEVIYEAPAPGYCAEPCRPAGQELAVNLSDGSLRWIEPEPILDPGVAWQTSDMLRAVITSGTARAAADLGRSDLAGKTGTTNEYRDAWFAGFNGSLVATAWMGFDNNDPLGRGESGGRAALPIWIDFMREALRDQPEAHIPRPDNLIESGGRWLTETQRSRPVRGEPGTSRPTESSIEDTPELIF